MNGLFSHGRSHNNYWYHYHTLQGLNVHSEESQKSVPILMSSVYGHRPPLETPGREHVRVGLVQRDFYRQCGTNMNPNAWKHTLCHPLWSMFVLSFYYLQFGNSLIFLIILCAIVRYTESLHSTKSNIIWLLIWYQGCLQRSIGIGPLFHKSDSPPRLMNSTSYTYSIGIGRQFHKDIWVALLK